jgi:hypothetical protein
MSIAEEKGKQARILKKPITANPYKKGGDKDKWRKGWLEQDNFAKSWGE